MASGSVTLNLRVVFDGRSVPKESLVELIEHAKRLSVPIQIVRDIEADILFGEGGDPPRGILHGAEITTEERQ